MLTVKCHQPCAPTVLYARAFMLTLFEVNTYYFPAEDDDEGPTLKEKAIELCMKGIEVFCVWDCCWPWITFQKTVALLVFDPFVELFITLCIVVNTLFMALDHHDMNPDMDRALKSGNYVSIFVFVFKKNSLMRFSVFYGNICDRSDYETDSNESKILLPRGVEYFRFYHSSLVPT